MMETDLVNSVWHLCSPWITGLRSEALQWKTQLQFFNEHLATLSFNDLYCRLCVLFWASHLVSRWFISQKADAPVLFYVPLEGSGEVGVDSPLWNSNIYVQITVLCLIAIPEMFLMERQQNSSRSWPRGVWDLQHWKYLDQVDLLRFLPALV